MKRDFHRAHSNPPLGSRRERPFSQVNTRAIQQSSRYKRAETPNAAYNMPGRGVSGESTN